MSETPERLASRLAEEGQKTQQFFLELTPVQWERTLYTDGAQWTVGQVLAHFVITEVGIRSLIGAERQTFRLCYPCRPAGYQPSGKPEICLTSRDAIEK